MQEIITPTPTTDKAFSAQAKSTETAAGGRSEVNNGRSFQQEFESQQAATKNPEATAEGQGVVEENGNRLPAPENTDPSAEDTSTVALQTPTDQELETPVTEVLTAVDPGWQAYFGSLMPAQANPDGQQTATSAAIMRPAANTVTLNTADPLQPQLTDTAETIDLRTLQTSTEDDATTRGDIAPSRVITRADQQQTTQNNLATEDVETIAIQKLNVKQSGAEGDQGTTGNRQNTSPTALFNSVSALATAGAEQPTSFSAVMGAASGSLQASALTQSGQMLQAAIPEAFGTTNWSQGLGKQVMMMVNQNMQTAELRMNPAHLGPIEVRIEMEDDQVNVNFTSRHAVVREAMEQAIPRLREMLDEQGLNLGGSDISQQSFAEQQTDGQGDGGHTAAMNVSAEEGATEASDSQAARVSSIDSLVDYYI